MRNLLANVDMSKLADNGTSTAQNLSPDRLGSKNIADSNNPESTPDQAALVQMIQQHSRFVYRIAYSVVRNPADAEDVVQETFLQLLRQNQRNFIQDERSYLARIVWRLAVRRKQRPPPEELPASLASSGKGPEAAVIEDQTQIWFHTQIDALPEKLRQPLALTALGELSSPEIALILGIPEGTVRSRIHTARQTLRQRWEKRNRS